MTTPPTTDQPINSLPDAMAEPVTPNTAATEAVTDPTSQATEEALLQKVLEYKNAAMRATADYRNLQREADQKMAEVRKYGTEQLLLELCPLVDYFDSALAAIPEEQKQQGWVQGVQHLQDYLMKLLHNHQVERMITAGQVFNPALHESVGAVASDLPEQTIVKELQAGFLLQGKVIRPAKVMIVKQKQKNDLTKQNTHTLPSTNQSKINE